MVESEINLLPESVVQKREDSSFQKEEGPFVPGVLPQTQAFLADIVKTKAYLELDGRRRNLIGIYFGTFATLEKLKEVAQVNSRERVRQLITSGMKALWQNLPPSLQEKHQRERVIQLKRGFSPETRARISEARKGRTFSPETRARISEARKEQWQDPQYRARISEARKQYWKRKKGESS